MTTIPFRNHRDASLRDALRLVAAMLLVSVPVISAQSSSATNDSIAISEARTLLSQHHPERAESLLLPLVAREPINVSALTLLAEARVQQGDREQAKALLLRAISAMPDSPDANNAMGDLLLTEHHDPEAMDRFETVLAADARNPEARKGELSAATGLALSARKAEHPEVALEVLQHARTRLPDDPQLLLDLGIQATELHRLPEATEALNEARKLEPRSPEILYALAQLELEQQQMAAAETDLRTYLTIRPNDPSAHFGLGHVLAMVQRTDEARTEFERSIQLQPVQTESYYQVGQIELDAQHDDKAEPLFRKVLARDPNHGGALTGMGILAFRHKDYTNAEQYLSAAEKSAPDYGPAHYYRGLTLTRLGRKDEANIELRRATELGRANGSPSPPDPQ
jgi:Flp pilus assembly protein TadD